MSDGRLALRGPRDLAASMSRWPRMAPRLLGLEAPAHGPVLGLHLIAPAECAGPVVEVSIPQRTAVDEPYDDRSVRTRSNHSVRQQAIGAPHSPHDGRLVIPQSHRSLGHASTREARVIPALGIPFLIEAARRRPRRSRAGRQRWRRRRYTPGPALRLPVDARFCRRYSVESDCLPRCRSAAMA